MAPVTFGKFKIKHELGRGAMGVVYAAEDPSRGEVVALKVVSSAPVSAEARQRRLERFLREAQVLASLKHPSVVQCYERGEVNGRHYFTMELLQGHTLQEHLRIDGPLPLTRWLSLAIDLCRALDHTHSRWVIHRDLKPENVMLLPGGDCRLMDFGIARIATPDEPLPDEQIDGSPAYMSPEQVSQQPVDHRTDIYSLGVTLYEAVTGRRAVEGDSLPAILHRVVYEYPPAPRVPPAVKAILRRSLAKQPQHRYQTANQMLHDLVDVAGAAPPACSIHPQAPAAGACSRCSKGVCEACMVQTPGAGILCRPCAFTQPPLAPR